MLFNSLDFLIFLPLVFCLYWGVIHKNLKWQNALILIASYVFYGWWDWRFLSLIFISTLVDYLVGLQFLKEITSKQKKVWLWVSVLVNIGLLGFFKYFNFFVDSFVSSFTFLGMEVSSRSFTIILPIGISFYTFQTLSYTIDLYRNKIKPTKDFVAFAAFVSFFPQLVIGPIERAKNMLPQFTKRRVFNNDEAIIGIKQFVWGLFKKVVIADGCAQYVNEIFYNHSNYSSLTLCIGAIYFAFQIYADFSGYSDMAIGIARLFGIRLMTNFKYPFFTKNIADFWRHWHISLSTWFRDYIFFPLGGSKGNTLKTVRNIIVVFLISGLWHGADWTFIAFGAYFGLVAAIQFVLGMTHKRGQSFSGSIVQKMIQFFQMGSTFLWFALGMIIFRSSSITKAYQYIYEMFQFTIKVDLLNTSRYAFELIPLLGIFILIEWFSRHKEFPLYSSKYSLFKVSLVITMIIFFGSFSNVQDFIYFRF